MASDAGISPHQTQRRRGAVASCRKVRTQWPPPAPDLDPLPDEAGREKLVRLYGKDLRLGQAVVAEAVRRTEESAPPSSKEMMRRTPHPATAKHAAQSHSDSPRDPSIARQKSIHFQALSTRYTGNSGKLWPFRRGLDEYADEATSG